MAQTIRADEAGKGDVVTGLDRYGRLFSGRVVSMSRCRRAPGTRQIVSLDLADQVRSVYAAERLTLHGEA